jgi:hypothetical protein
MNSFGVFAQLFGNLSLVHPVQRHLNYLTLVVGVTEI